MFLRRHRAPDLWKPSKYSQLVVRPSDQWPGQHLFVSKVHSPGFRELMTNNCMCMAPDGVITYSSLNLFTLTLHACKVCDEMKIYRNNHFKQWKLISVFFFFWKIGLLGLQRILGSLHIKIKLLTKLHVSLFRRFKNDKNVWRPCKRDFISAWHRLD